LNSQFANAVALAPNQKGAAISRHSSHHDAESICSTAPAALVVDAPPVGGGASRADCCKVAHRPASSKHHVGSIAASVALYLGKNGPAVASCASLPSNLFRATQGRTLMLTLKAFIALVVTWCLLAVAAMVAASIQRFEDLYLYVVAAAVFVGLIIIAGIAMAP
jgi:hypothetical protein